MNFNPFKKIKEYKEIFIPESISRYFGDLDFDPDEERKFISKHSQNGWEYSGTDSNNIHYYFTRQANIVMVWFRKRQAIKKVRMRNRQRLEEGKPKFKRMLKVCKNKQMY